MFIIHNGRWVNNSNPTTPLNSLELHQLDKHIKGTMSSIFGHIKPSHYKINAISQIVQADDDKSNLVDKLLSSNSQTVQKIKLHLGI